MPPPLFRIQNSFAGGEFSPSMYSRTDIAKYLSGLKTGRNINILPTGAARNRPGTMMVATAGDSTNPIRLIDFIASTSQAYVIELGQYYARFYTNGAQVQVFGASAWVTSFSYVVGNFVTFGGLNYYCLKAHTSGTFATDLAAGDWVQQNTYQIVTPWAAADLNSVSLHQPLKKAQSADVMYFAHPSYPPQVLTFNSASNWTIAPYAFINGPFMLQNTSVSKTLTPSGIKNGAGTKNISSVFESAYSVPTPPTYQVSMQTTVAHGLSNGQQIEVLGMPGGEGAQFNFKFYYVKVTTTTDFELYSDAGLSAPIQNTYENSNGYFGTIFGIPPDPSLGILGSREVGPSTTCSIYQAYPTAIPAAPTTNYQVGLVTSTAHGLTTGMQTNVASLDGVLATQLNGNSYYVSVLTTTSFLLYHDSGLSSLVQYTGTSDGHFTTYTPGAGTIGVSGAINLTASFNLFLAGHVGALFQLTRTITAQTISGTMSNNSTASTAIQCGSTWSIVTFGGWTGKILIQVSVDGTVWNTVQTLQSVSGTNYQVSGDTGFSQCYLRVTGDGTTTWASTLTYDLTADSFDWNGIVQIVSITSPTVAVINILTSTQNAWPLADTNSTYQWSEGSWSTLRGWPTCLVFFQDRLVWASTMTEPATGWATKTASYLDFGISSPIVASDSLSFVLPSRQLNAISTLTVMPQFMVAETSDSEWGIGPDSSGVFSPTSINIQLQGHRGSSSIDPVVVGVEILLMQQMGTVLRNLIYQLAVSGFMGDDISIISQHLFTGYQITQMAYQQEPDSIVWMIRNDGQMISLTYLREQEVAAFTHHDTLGTFESIAVIPNQTLGINEVWLSTVRTIGGQTVRFIERMVPRDQGTIPANQFFVDCGLTYTGAPATVISGLSYLNGQTVAILADGNVVPQQVVTGGTITLAVAASIVTVGLPYVSDLETLAIEAPDNKGTLQGRRVTISRATLRFWNSRGGYFGPKSPSDQGTAGLFPIIQREVGDPLNTPIPLKTRDYLQDIDGGYDWGARLFFRQIDPLPFTITGIIAQLEAGEN